MPFPLLLLAAAAAPVAAKPVGPWVVNVDENMCLLERSYPAGADGKGQQVLVFQPLLDLPTMDFYVMTARSGPSGQIDGTFTVRAEPGGKRYTGHYYSALIPKGQHRVTRMTLDRAVLDELHDGDTLTVSARPINTSFTIVRPEKARPALAGCIADLKKSWGVDDARAAQIVTPLDGNPASYFSYDVYPPEALQQGIYGRVVALLNISTEGTVDHCRIVSSAGTALNAGTCKVAARMRFKPARDKDGQPVAATYLLPVRWTIPGAPE